MKWCKMTWSQTTMKQNENSAEVYQVTNVRTVRSFQQNSSHQDTTKRLREAHNLLRFVGVFSNIKAYDSRPFYEVQ
mgnify:CR=1 FL=1